MIALIGNRPAIQIGRHQVHDYDTAWLASALHRAAEAADRKDFPFLEEISKGIEQYLETKCSLQLLPLSALFDRMRRMLEQIGCPHIACKLEPLAPPVTISLTEAATEAGNGFELAFFGLLREELEELRAAGVEEIRFTGLRQSVLILSGRQAWDESCNRLFAEIRAFLHMHDREERSLRRPMRLHLENDRAK